ncbi:MAG TPA: hypothetical protein VIB00_19000, partial [Pyrinomonadaceae bacterium]
MTFAKEIIKSVLVNARRNHDMDYRETINGFGFATVLTVLTLLLMLSVASGQQIGITTQYGVNPPRGTYAIRNAHIITVSGADIENGTIVIRDGKIAAVGATVDVPAGAQTIDARGQFVYPGMIDIG